MKRRRRLSWGGEPIERRARVGPWGLMRAKLGPARAAVGRRVLFGAHLDDRGGGGVKRQGGGGGERGGAGLG